MSKQRLRPAYLPPPRSLARFLFASNSQTAQTNEGTTPRKPIKRTLLDATSNGSNAQMVHWFVAVADTVLVQVNYHCAALLPLAQFPSFLSAKQL